MCSLKRDWPLMHFFAQRTLNSLLSFYSLTFRETWHIFSYCKLIKMKLLHACSATIKETFMISKLLLLLLCLTSLWNGMHFSKEEVVQCDTLEPFILLISALLHPSGEDGAFKASWAPRNWWTSQNGKMEMKIYWTHFLHVIHQILPSSAQVNLRWKSEDLWEKSLVKIFDFSSNKSLGFNTSIIDGNFSSPKTFFPFFFCLYTLRV